LNPRLENPDRIQKSTVFKNFSNLIANPVTRLIWSKRVATAIIFIVVGLTALTGLSIALLNSVVVPRVSDWRSDIERISSEYLGSQVRISQIEVDSSKIIPTFKINGLTIQSLNEQAELETLSLPEIRLSMSLRSILSLSFDQIVLENPELSVIKNSDGQIRIAGLSSVSNSNTKGLDWFFSQPNIQVHRATAMWLDKGLAKGVVQFKDLDLYFFNGLKSHEMRLEVTPPSELGERFSIQGHFKESLLSTHAGNFYAWSGTSLFKFPHIDLALIDDYLPRHVNWDIQAGKGWLRVWTDMHHGVIEQVTTDLSFPELGVAWSSLTSKDKKTQFKDLSGRFQLSLKGATQQFKALDLNFFSEDGNHWSMGNASYSWTEKTGLVKDESTSPNNFFSRLIPLHGPGSGVIELDKISIKPVLNQLNNFSVDSDVLRNLKNIEVAGDLQNFKMIWDFDGLTTSAYNLQGKLSNFTFNRLQNADENFLKGLPGLQNAAVQFNFNKKGGTASVAVEDGSITLSRWLDEPVIPLMHANADLQWSIDERALSLKINKTKIVNSDVNGDFDLNWSIPRGDKVVSGVNSSVIDLNINVQRGEAKQIYRYLPLKVDARVRQYLQKAISQGVVKNGSIKIKGPLNKFPFVEPSEGEFHINTSIEDLTYQYALTDGAESKIVGTSKQWPELIHLNADLVIDRKSLFVKKGNTKLNSNWAPNLEWVDLAAEIPDLFKPTVNVKTKGRGPLADVLKLINSSAVGDLLEGSLSKADTTPGINAEYLLNLSLPLNDLNHSKVLGSVDFSNNDVTLMPGLPTLNRLRGTLNFNESGFFLTGVKARILGNESKIDGGLKFSSDKSESTKADPTILKIQGLLSSEGLKQSRENSVVSKLGQYLSGQTNYFATLTNRKGQLDFEFNSSLQGLMSQLPAPLSKNSDVVLPLKINTSIITQQIPQSKSASSFASTQTRVLKTNITLGQIGLGTIVSEIGSAPFKPSSANASTVSSSSFVTKGWVGINTTGNFAVPTSFEPGYLVSIEVPKLDADAWDKALSNLTAPLESIKTSKKDASHPSTTISATPSIPLTLKIKTGELIYSGRSAHQVTLDAVYQDVQPSGQWHLNISSEEARGAIDYRIGSANTAPKVFARMSLLVIPPTALDTVESLLTNNDSVLPALDIIVDEFEIKGKKLGHAEIEALNQSLPDGGREWRINKLNLTVPEAKFQGTGVWAFVKDSNKNQKTRKTTLDFYLDIDNSGLLLDRMGTKGAVSGGKGRLSGQVTWLGSPMQMDYPTLGGHFNVNVEKGSFLKTEPGAGRLLGVLNLQALPRRLLLDFKDIFSDGFAFDFFRGDVNIETGIAKTNNLQMKSVNAAVLMEGRADIANETQNLKVIVIPEIDAGTASLVVAAINPVIGISTYLAQYFLKKPISQATTRDFLVEGTWSDPKVTRIESKTDIKNENKSNRKP